ncbi:MAG: methyltransferase [Pseudomonadota bacterium]
MSAVDPARLDTRPTFAQSIRRWRNGLLSSKKFQAFATAFPLTRPLARRNAAKLFNLCTGFVHSQVLLACVRLDVFQILSSGPVSVRDLAARIDIPLDGTERLVQAAASIDLLSTKSDTVDLGDLGAALLGNPSVFAMIRHHAALYEDLRDPVALLQERSHDTHIARYWRYERGTASEENASSYSDLMAQTQAFIASEILHAYEVSRHSTIMDVGGGAGAFLCEAAHHTDANLILADLPHVTPLAETRFSAEHLSDRATTMACNALEDPLPTGADLITLIRVLHDHDDGAVRTMLSACRDALPAGGRLLIAEPMAETKGAKPMGHGYFGLYLWAMGQGRPRSKGELRAFLREAGFSTVRELKSRQPLLVRILIAS